MIRIGIDDTDTLDSPGTNQLARRIAAALPAGYALAMVVRHQLLFDPRIPYTSQNGSASIGVHDPAARGLGPLLPLLAGIVRAWYVEGSDPGLCVAEHVPAEVTAFGRRCQLEPVAQDDARALAAAHGVYLEGFGGTEGGVIGALAAVGLLAGGDDGRVVHLPAWSWPDPFAGMHDVAELLARGVAAVREHETGRPVADGKVDVGKHLRPALRGGLPVLFVEREGAVGAHPPAWRAVKLP